MDFNKLTLKSQEAVAAAQELARRMGNPELYPEHLLLALLDQELPQQLVPDPRACARRPRRRCARGRPSRAPRSSRTSRARSARCSTRPSTRRAGWRTSTSRPSTCCSRSTSSRATQLEAKIKEVRGGQRVTSPGPGGHLPGAREVRPRPDRARGERQARPGHRPRRGDPPRDPGPEPPHEEQPGPDRRPRRRQDRDRRGPRAADRRRRRPRGPEGQARLGARHRRDARRLEVPRRVRGAAQGRTHRGAERRGRPDPLHRRAAHDRRRGRGRGRRRRGRT